MAFRHDGQRLVAGCRPKDARANIDREPMKVILYDTTTGQALDHLEITATQGRIFNSTGSHLAVVHIDGKTWQIWDMEGKKIVASMTYPEKAIRALGPGENGKDFQLLRDSVLETLDSDTGTVISRRSLKGLGRTGVERPFFSANGQWLALTKATARTSIRMYRTSDGAPGRSMDLLSAATARTLSPDGKYLAAASYGGTANTNSSIVVWDTEKGQRLHSLGGHTGRITGLAFSPNGRRLASAGLDKVLVLWETTTGREILTIRGDAGFTGRLAFSPNGERLASLDAEGAIQIWDARPWEGEKR
jgi:WD40 repeat protein